MARTAVVSAMSEELRGLMEFFGRTGVRIIAITGRHDSTLARNAAVVLPSDVAEEACPHDLAPTSSTTAALAAVELWGTAGILVIAFGIFAAVFATWGNGADQKRVVTPRAAAISWARR